MTDKSARCGAKHPKQPEVCTRDVGHVGMHSNGGNVTWKKDTAQAKNPPEVVDSETHLMRSHRRKQAEARAEAAERAKAKKAPPLAPRFCNEREGDTMRVCTLAPGHEGDHDSGVKTWPATTQCVDRAGGHGMRCERDAGHDGLHKNGRATWKDKSKPAADLLDDQLYEMVVAKPGQTAPQLGRRYTKAIARLEAAGRIEWRDEGWWPVETQARCSASQNNVWHEPAVCELDAGHSGDHAATVVVSDGWPETGQTRRIAWDEHGRGTGNEILSKPTPMTLDDEPEDPEADEAALAAMDAEGVDELDDEVRSDEERDFARKMREEREAHARELEHETSSATGGDGAQGDPAPVDDAGGDDGIVDMKQTVGRHLSEIEVHPAAEEWPMLEGEEYEAFREDIRRNGVRVRPVLDVEGLLVDGRNRIRACIDLGLDVEFDRLPPGTDVLDYIISLNLRRRQLNASQKSMYAEAIASLRPGRPRESGSTAGLTQEQAAERFGVSPRSIREARIVRENAAPEVVEAVQQGKLSVDAAAKLAKLPQEKQRAIYEREIKPKKQMVRGGKIKALTKQEEKRAIVRKINEGRVAPMPAGLFGVIYGDYPWDFENSDQHEGSRGHMDYPGMPMPDILVHAREAAKRAARNCIVALWYVDSFFNEIRDVLAAYGATPRRQWVWDKCTKNDKDKSGVGTWGRPRQECLVIASIGNPTHTLNEVDTLIRAAVREPGRKPDVVAELLQKHCAGPFLELFAREPRNELWSVWGAETDKFATEAA